MRISLVDVCAPVLGVVVLAVSCAGEGTKPKTDDDAGSGAASTGGGSVYQPAGTGGTGATAPYGTGGTSGSGGHGTPGTGGGSSSYCTRRGECNPAVDTTCVTSDGATCTCAPEDGRWRNCR
jgi:hypothetical protein